MHVDDDDKQALVDDKEQLLADGNAEEAWSLFLLEQQDKLWSDVREEVRFTHRPGILTPSSVAFALTQPSLRLVCAGSRVQGPVREPRPALGENQAHDEGRILLQPAGKQNHTPFACRAGWSEPGSGLLSFSSHARE